MSVESVAESIPPGYQKTEVGVIPEDWNILPLDSFLSFISYGFTNPMPTSESGIHMITAKDINRGKILFDTARCTTENAYRTLLTDKSRPKTGDLLLTKDGALGRLALADEKRICINQSVAVLRPNSKADAKFLKVLLEAPQYQSRMLEDAGGSTIKHIYITIVNLMPIAVPPTLAEQESIATALSDTDALIESLEQLIAKKRQIKQGAMQELLTGKRRLPGFSGEWEMKLLGEVIASCSSGATPYRGRPDYYKGKVKWITSGELNYNLITDTLEHISKEAVEHTNLKIHPIGTFLMAITGLEAAGTRGACGIVGSPATTNQSCMAVYPTSELKTEYLYHYYVFCGNELALQYCQGTKQQSYTAKLVKLLPINLPPSIEEQTAIATILSDMDAEITSLEEKLAKTRQMKQGMMQELLTGRIRLI